MPAPVLKPWFCDAIGGSEVTFPHTAEEAGWLCDGLASTAAYFPDWMLERENGGSLPVRLAVLAREGGHTEIGFSAGGVEGVLRAEVDASGWVKLTVEVDGRQAFEGYMDRPYEEHPIWPADADPARGTEEPARMGKRLTWVSLSLRGGDWPALGPIAEDGMVNVRVADRD